MAEGLLRYLWGATLLALYVNTFPTSTTRNQSEDVNGDDGTYTVSYAWGALTLFACALVTYQEWSGHDMFVTTGGAMLLLMVLTLQRQ